MKHLYFLFIFFVSFGTYSQETDFEKQFTLLLSRLESENWTESEKISKELLEFTSNKIDLKNEEKVLRYMFLISTSGLMNEGKITQDKALKNVLFLKNKEMILASHPFHTQCRLNCTKIAEDKKDTFYNCVTNNTGTQIFSFEYIEIKGGIKETVTELEGKSVHIKATLKDILVEGNILPRFKLNFIDGEYYLD